MSAPCSEDFRALADELGGIDCDAEPVLALRAPWALDNWTLPVVEALMVAGAALALAHAVVMLRRGRPAWLGLWLATVLYVLVLEPPLYFPESFGLEDSVGLVFAHNVFSVEFLYDRLPLYIVALYPAGIYLAHALVDRLGVFRRHGIVAGAAAAGLVHHAFYQVFDQLGPQLRWWAWNRGVESGELRLASVPLSSMVIFAAVTPTVVVGLARWLLFTGEEGRSRRAWAGRVVAVGLLTVASQVVTGLPLRLLGGLDGDGRTADAVVLVAMLVAVAAVGLRAILRSDPAGPETTAPADRYPELFGAAFLLVFALLWATALPDLLDATGGRTPGGTPIGSPPYALGCAALAAWVVARVARAPAGAPAPGAGPDAAAGPAREPAGSGPPEATVAGEAGRPAPP